MTAASIKMDELLVNWLGKDHVYADILQYVETLSSTDDAEDIMPKMMKELKLDDGDRTPTKSIPPFYPNKNPAMKRSLLKNSNTNAVTNPLLSWSAAQPLAEAVFRDLGSSQDEEDDYGNLCLSPDAFVRVTKEICRFPSYFSSALYQRILDRNSGGDGMVSLRMFQAFWMDEMEDYDECDRFFRLIKQPQAEAIYRDDFLPFLKALLSDHPGLEFLASHDEFQEKYAISIITRIFYHTNTSHSGSITSRQLRHSDLLEAFQVVDEEEDINKIPRYFSYEHFYVLYCRFWELDDDRDYKLTRDNLLKYGEHSLSHMIVDRIFEAAPRPFGMVQKDYLTFEDFIYFMLAEEDKANEISIRYWFDCLDVDADGKLNNMEMRSFYAVQLHRMQCMGHEIVPFEDMLCQMMDMIKPANPDFLVVSDFLQKECSSVAGALFDALFNLNKYLMFEQRDPFVERQKREDDFQTEWDRFAFADYNRLAMEEEAREEEAMEIDWVTVDEEEEAAAAAAEGRKAMERTPAIEAPF